MNISKQIATNPKAEKTISSTLSFLVVTLNCEKEKFNPTIQEWFCAVTFKQLCQPSRRINHGKMFNLRNFNKRTVHIYIIKTTDCNELSENIMITTHIFPIKKITKITKYITQATTLPTIISTTSRN